MKNIKMIISLLAGILLTTSLTTFAAPDLSSLHASKQSVNAPKTVQAPRAGMYVNTDVHVLNNSNQMITVKVPGTTINDNLYPHEIEDILSDLYFDAVEVVLYDINGYEFFRDYVPNHATVEVTNTYYYPRGAKAPAGNKAVQVKAAVKK